MSRLLELIKRNLLKKRSSSLSQFVFQPSIFAPRMYTYQIKNEKAVMEHVEGKSLGDIANDGSKEEQKWFYENRYEVIRQLAHIYTDIVRLGAVYEDLNWENIIAQRTEIGGIKLYLIDYENKKLIEFAKKRGKKLIDPNAILESFLAEAGEKVESELEMGEALKEGYTKLTKRTLRRLANFADGYEAMYLPSIRQNRIKQKKFYKYEFKKLFDEYLEEELQKM